MVKEAPFGRRQDVVNRGYGRNKRGKAKGARWNVIIMVRIAVEEEVR